MIGNQKRIENRQGSAMYHYQTQNIYDEEIDFILRFLFEYAPIQQKRLLIGRAIYQFEQLDLAAQYLLFSLVKERLPHRAKLLFAAEDYLGKKHTILEVMQHGIK